MRLTRILALAIVIPVFAGVGWGYDKMFVIHPTDIKEARIASPPSAITAGDLAVYDRLAQRILAKGYQIPLPSSVISQAIEANMPDSEIIMAAGCQGESWSGGRWWANQPGLLPGSLIELENGFFFHLQRGYLGNRILIFGKTAVCPPAPEPQIIEKTVVQPVERKIIYLTRPLPRPVPSIGPPQGRLVPGSNWGIQVTLWNWNIRRYQPERPCDPWAGPGPPAPPRPPDPFTE